MLQPRARGEQGQQMAKQISCSWRGLLQLQTGEDEADALGTMVIGPGVGVGGRRGAIMGSREGPLIGPI